MAVPPVPPRARDRGINKRRQRRMQGTSRRRPRARPLPFARFSRLLVAVIPFASFAGAEAFAIAGGSRSRPSPPWLDLPCAIGAESSRPLSPNNPPCPWPRRPRAVASRSPPVVDDHDPTKGAGPLRLHRSSPNKAVSRRIWSIASAAGLFATPITNLVTPRSAAAIVHGTLREVDTFTDDAPSAVAEIPSLTVPLFYRSALSAYTVSYSVGGSNFGAIVDTGSPFLLVPKYSESTCNPEYEWGCLRPGDSMPAGLGSTVERFDGNEGRVEWREGKFSFNTPANEAAEADRGAAAWAENVASAESLLFPRAPMTFGVISESLMDGPGGIFLGLVKYTDGRIRPSFLGQSNVSAFSVDLRERRDGRPKTLTLYGGANGSRKRDTLQSKSNKRIIKSFDGRLVARDSIPLVRDLNRRFGDPTIHYVGLASSISVNGHILASESPRNRIYCIFDTGCSGMSVSPNIFDKRYAVARAGREKSLWGLVEIEFETQSGSSMTLSAHRPITTPLANESPWGRRIDGCLVILGLSFLEGRRTTVDIDGGWIWLES